MVRMTDLPATSQASMANLETPEFADRPFVSGPPSEVPPHCCRHVGRTGSSRGASIRIRRHGFSGHSRRHIASRHSDEPCVRQF